MVGILEVTELISGMEIESSGKSGLQSDDLVKSFQFVTLIYYIMTDTEMNGKYRHYQLHPGRETERKLL